MSRKQLRRESRGQQRWQRDVVEPRHVHRRDHRQRRQRTRRQEAHRGVPVPQLGAQHVLPQRAAVGCKRRDDGRHRRKGVGAVAEREVVRRRQDLDAEREGLRALPADVLLEGRRRRAAAVDLAVKQRRREHAARERRQVRSHDARLVRARERPAHVARRVAHVRAHAVAAAAHVESQRRKHARHRVGQPRRQQQAAATQLRERQAAAVPRGVALRGRQQPQHRRDDVVRELQRQAPRHAAHAFGGGPPHHRVAVPQPAQQQVDDVLHLRGHVQVVVAAAGGAALSCGDLPAAGRVGSRRCRGTQHARRGEVHEQ